MESKSMQDLQVTAKSWWLSLVLLSTELLQRHSSTGEIGVFSFIMMCKVHGPCWQCVNVSNSYVLDDGWSSSWYG